MASPSDVSQELPTVIVGGGIVGASAAYYLAKRGRRSLLLESVGVASAASGKAGGFLAKDWCQGAVGKLAEISFQLHADLAAELGADCGYRRLDTLSLLLERSYAEPAGQQRPDVPPWVTGCVGAVSCLGDCATTAQVHPRKLTQALLDRANQLVGTQVRLAEATGIRQQDNRVTHVEISSGEAVPCSNVIFAMGPWTSKALGWLGLQPGLISGQRAHSIVVQPSAPVSAHALFLEFADGMSPEVYPRPDGTVYLCGLADSLPLPPSAADVVPDEQRIAELVDAATACSSLLATDRVVSQQACYLPVSQRGRPLIGRVPRLPNAFVAAGHSCWGILNGPATGRVLADLVLDGDCYFMDIASFRL